MFQTTNQGLKSTQPLNFNPEENGDQAILRCWEPRWILQLPKIGVLNQSKRDRSISLKKNNPIFRAMLEEFHASIHRHASWLERSEAALGMFMGTG